jgi:hypothetical protein
VEASCDRIGYGGAAIVGQSMRREIFHRSRHATPVQPEKARRELPQIVPGRANRQSSGPTQRIRGVLFQA